MPSTSEGFYWMNGAFNYTVGNIVLLFLLYLLLSSHQVLTSEEIYKKFIYILLCSLLSVAVVGSCEILAVFFLAVSFLGVVITSYTKHYSSTIWRIVLGVTTVSVAISFLSPGSSRRYDMASEQESIDYSYKLISSFIVNFIRSLNSWAIDPILLSTSLLFIPTAILLSKNIKIFNDLTPKKWLFLGYFAIWLILVAVTFLLPYLSVGSVPGRVLNISYFIFLLGWFLGIVILFFINKNKSFEEFSIPKYILVSAQTIIIMGLIFESNFERAVNDLLVKAPNYNSELQNRYELIEKKIATNQRKVEVSALEKKASPETIYLFNDITNDSKYNLNKCYAKFFKLDSIATVKKR